MTKQFSLFTPTLQQKIVFGGGVSKKLKFKINDIISFNVCCLSR